MEMPLLVGFVLTLLYVPSECSSITYNVYHRHSDEVIRVLGSSGLPKKGTAKYYSAWVAHDQYRQFSATQHSPALSFEGGGVITPIQYLGNLHYAQIEVGTPPVSLMVALDTGSVTTWLPCGCNPCARSFKTDTGEQKYLSFYNPRSSSTSAVVFCDSPECYPKTQCRLLEPEPCPFEIKYISFNTSTRGILVKDVLHMETYDMKHTAIDAPIIFGCAEVVTGSLLKDAAINGLLGLGQATLDMTSLLSSKGFVRNSFSVCLAFNGNGRIAFGDKGAYDQMETPLDTRGLPIGF